MCFLLPLYKNKIAGFQGIQSGKIAVIATACNIQCILHRSCPVQGSATFFALRTGLKLKLFGGPAFKNHKCSAMNIYYKHVSYCNFDAMRTLSLFCRNETLPPRNYGTHWHLQYVPHIQSVSRFRLCCCHHRKSRLAEVACRKWQQSLLLQQGQVILARPSSKTLVESLYEKHISGYDHLHQLK